jgi:hypothetical protein
MEVSPESFKRELKLFLGWSLFWGGRLSRARTPRTTHAMDCHLHRRAKVQLVGRRYTRGAAKTSYILKILLFGFLKLLPTVARLVIAAPKTEKEQLEFALRAVGPLLRSHDRTKPSRQPVSTA